MAATVPFARQGQEDTTPMNWQTTALALAASICLSACFLSGASNIQTGVHLAEGSVSFCTDDDPPCQTGFPEGDGYIIYSGDPEEEDLRLRFEVLTETGTGTVYVGEAELRNEEGSSWAYLMAHAAVTPGEGFPEFDIIMPACNDAEPSVQSAYGITRADAYSCEIGDFAAFRRYLVDTYSDQFDDPAFWRERDPL